MTIKNTDGGTIESAAAKTRPAMDDQHQYGVYDLTWLAHEIGQPYRLGMTYELTDVLGETVNALFGGINGDEKVKVAVAITKELATKLFESPEFAEAMAESESGACEAAIAHTGNIVNPETGREAPFAMVVVILARNKSAVMASATVAVL